MAGGELGRRRPTHGYNIAWPGMAGCASHMLPSPTSSLVPARWGLHINEYGLDVPPPPAKRSSANVDGAVVTPLKCRWQPSWHWQAGVPRNPLCVRSHSFCKLGCIQVLAGHHVYLPRARPAPQDARDVHVHGMRGVAWPQLSVGRRQSTCGHGFCLRMQPLLLPVPAFCGSLHAVPHAALKPSRPATCRGGGMPAYLLACLPAYLLACLLA